MVRSRLAAGVAVSVQIAALGIGVGVAVVLVDGHAAPAPVLRQPFWFSDLFRVSSWFRSCNPFQGRS